jgi:hypothetical protein
MSRRRFPLHRSWLGAASLAVALSTACGSPPDVPAPEVPETPADALPISLDSAFVAVPRAVSASQRQQVEQQLQGAVDDSGTSFYLAIRRSELAQRWFMSAYLKQAHPGGVLYNAATSLGTRVVSFKEQNGKLFVLDVADGKAMSDVFDPDLLVEAYPVVSDYGPFNRTRGSDQYVLIDPTAGLNRFGVVGDLLGPRRIQFNVELSFAQRFRTLADGVAFEQVYTGYMDVPDDLAHYFLENNPYRYSGTLALSLRKYSEGPGFTPTPRPETDHYFLSDERIIPNTGGYTEQTPVKWNIRPGMKPIRWNITPTVLTLQNDPRYQQYDVVGALKRGIEGWNQVFGFKALEAVVADSTQSFADDDKNFLILDTDEGMPFAFANMRTNPNTGEIRGASVYLPALWLWLADSDYSDDLSEAALTEGAAPHPSLRMSWAGMAGGTLCDQEVPKAGALAASPELASLTKKQKVEANLTNVVLHEIGHTLGLRHNFAGSRVYAGGPSTVRSTSVMDYIVEEDTVYGTAPGPYDVEAVRYLYGLSTQVPTLAFCTDQDTLVDPLCNRHDRFDDPLTKWYVPEFHDTMAQLMYSTANLDRLKSLVGFYMNPVLQFVRAGNVQAQATAYQLAMAQFRPPLQVPAGSPPHYAARADELARRTLARLYLDPAADRGSFKANPPNSSTLLPLVIADLKAILLNVDGVRSYASRRTMVDILKSQQVLASYSALREVRDTLTAQLPSLSGDERLQVEDLVARISEAVSPYYL